MDQAYKNVTVKMGGLRTFAASALSSEEYTNAVNRRRLSLLGLSPSELVIAVSADHARPRAQLEELKLLRTIVFILPGPIESGSVSDIRRYNLPVFLWWSGT